MIEQPQNGDGVELPAKHQGGWIGVDLDGTLADYSEGWQGPDKIGLPVKDMLNRVLQWRHLGYDVRILTARVASTNPDRDCARSVIEVWCERWIGERLPVTAEKDMAMIEQWDDRSIQVLPNTGIPVIVAAERLRQDNEKLKRLLRSKTSGKTQPIILPASAMQGLRNRGRQR